MTDKKDLKIEEDVSALRKAIEGLGKSESSRLLYFYGTTLNTSVPTCCTGLPIVKIKII